MNGETIPMEHPGRIVWDLRKIIDRLVVLVPSVVSISLFGSRRYRTRSRRSDIDLLVHTTRLVNSLDFRDTVHEEFAPVDMFKSHDLLNAESIANGSIISIQRPHETLLSQLDAVTLWENGTFSGSFDHWRWQETAKGIDYRMTVAEYPKDVDVRIVREDLEREGMPDTLLGLNWLEIGSRVMEIIARSVTVDDFFNVRAKTFTKSILALTSEYDFQNLVATVLQPWVPSFDRESVIIRYGDQKKVSDFALMGANIILEAKHVSDANTQAKVLKDLDGLRRFYSMEPTCKLILCAILCDYDSSGQPWLNPDQIAADFSRLHSEPVWITRVYPNRRRAVPAPIPRP